MSKLGLDCGLYYTADNEPGGTLVEVLKVGDVEVPREWTQVDISDRGSLINLYRKGVLEVGADFEIRDDGISEVTLAKFRSSWLPGGIPIYLFIADAKSTEGRLQIRGYFEVFTYSDSQKRGEAVKKKISIKPTFYNDTYPVVEEVAGA